MSRNGQPSHIVRRVLGGTVLLALAMVLLRGGLGVWDNAPGRVALRVERLLADRDAAQRKEGAWLAAGAGAREVTQRLCAGVGGGEAEPDVREAYAYALGRIGAPQTSTSLRTAAERDESGYVRQAAWLALARVDAHEFQRASSVERAEGGDAWDNIGIAEGGFELGDYSGFAGLMQSATAGTDWQRDVARHAIRRWIGPLLDTVGQWPIDADACDASEWSAATLKEIADRAARVDLSAIAAENRPHFEKSRRVQAYRGKLAKASQRIARVLFPSDGG